MSRALRALDGGYYAVKLCLAPDLVAFADTHWRGQGFANIAGYLNCVLNTALFHEMEADPPPPLIAAFDEQDDDIPFDPIPFWPLMSLSFTFSLSELNHSARDTFSGDKVSLDLTSHWAPSQ